MEHWSEPYKMLGQQCINKMAMAGAGHHSGEHAAGLQRDVPGALQAVGQCLWGDVRALIPLQPHWAERSTPGLHLPHPILVRAHFHQQLGQVTGVDFTIAHSCQEQLQLGLQFILTAILCVQN